MKYTEFNAYFRNLADLHKDIKSFIRINDGELDEAMKKDIDYPALVMDDYDGMIEPDGQGEFKDKQSCSFMILGHHNRRDQTQDEHEVAMSELKEIGLQIFARIFDDIAKKRYCPAPLKHISKQTIKYYFTPWYSDKVKGFYFEFTIVDKSSEMKLVQNKWSDFAPVS